MVASTSIVATACGRWSCSQATSRRLTAPSPCRRSPSPGTWQRSPCHSGAAASSNPSRKSRAVWGAGRPWPRSRASAASSRSCTRSSQRSPPAAQSANNPSTSCDGGRPRWRRLITTRRSSTAAAPLARNASITSGTPPWAVTSPVSARYPALSPLALAAPPLNKPGIRARMEAAPAPIWSPVAHPAGET
jgi:hypothetical protein